jgi:hypothetical protein
MRRIGTLGWILIVAVIVAVVLNVLEPDIGIYAAIALVLFLFGLVADGMGTTMNLIGDDLDQDQMTQPKRDALRRFAHRGRPDWANTAPDHADEPPELIWERERRRRGLR